MGEASIDRIYDASYSATYLGNFLDLLENLPGTVQRLISAAREIDITRGEAIQELSALQSQLLKETDPFAIKSMILKVEEKLLLIQELADEKLQINDEILDVIDNGQLQLESDFKNLGTEQDDKQENKDLQPERSSKRPRRVRLDNTNHNEIPMETIPISCPEKSSASKPIGTRGAAQKKVVKKKKKKTRTLDREDSPTEIPIDPNEPTYCLCEQVSYGEMIGCDNDLCPIEWFHFSCVTLTHKPKGKWFCPKCRGDKATVMKPRAQFLKELQKYNKEREERS